MYAEYPMIRFLEENGYDVSYTSGVDVSPDRRRVLLEHHKIFMSAGHDEYWSASSAPTYRPPATPGVNLAFFSGNEMFWKTRWEPSIDGSNTPNRTLVTYKETHYNAPTDPQDPPTWTGTWLDPRFSPPADGGHPENALTGQLFDVDCRHAPTSRCRRSTASCGSGATPGWPSLAPGQSTTLDAAPARSATSGTSTPTTGSGRPG